MNRKLAAPAALAVLVLMLPATAIARAPAHPSSNPVELALSAAERYWGGVPCGGDVTVTSTAAVPSVEETPAYQAAAAEGGETAMWTAFSTPAGGTLESEPPNTYWACLITVNTRSWSGWKPMDENFQEFCDAMTHEVGHLFGHDDAGQSYPESIAYPALGMANFNSVPQCRGVTLYYGHSTYRDLSEAESLCEQARGEAAERAHRDHWAACEA